MGARKAKVSWDGSSPVSVLPPPAADMANRENAHASYWFAEQRAMREWMEANVDSVAECYEQTDLWAAVQENHELDVCAAKKAACQELLSDVRTINRDMFAFVDNVKGDLLQDLPDDCHETIERAFPSTDKLWTDFVDALPEAEEYE